MTHRIKAGVDTEYRWDDFASRQAFKACPLRSPKVRLKRVESTENAETTRLQDNRYDVNGIRKRKLASKALPQVKNGNSSTEYTAGITTSVSKGGSGSSAAPTISYVMGHMLLGAEIDGVFRFHLMDAQGSVRDVVDDSGAVVKSFEFQEHGLPISSSGTGTFSPKTYQGGLSVNDDTNDSGLYLMGHRHFASDLGRFISRDPIGFRGGLNLYNGAGTNPVTRMDPNGLDGGSGMQPIQTSGSPADGQTPIDWWIWESTLPGPYGDPNPENWGSWNDLVDYVCSHGSGAERAVFISSLVTGVAATGTCQGG